MDDPVAVARRSVTGVRPRWPDDVTRIGTCAGAPERSTASRAARSVAACNVRAMTRRASRMQRWQSAT